MLHFGFHSVSKEIFFFKEEICKDGSAAQSSSAGLDKNLIFRFVVQFKVNYVTLYLAVFCELFTYCRMLQDVAAACEDGCERVRLRGQSFFTLLIKIIPVLKVSHVQKHAQAHTKLRRLLWLFCSRHSAEMKRSFHLRLFVPSYERVKPSR